MLHKKVGQLSGGQRQLLALAAQPPGGLVHLLDEPFSGLDAGAIRVAVAGLLTASDACILIAMPLKRATIGNATGHF
jgi:ABC-type multidrug transport system ATPase subunit